VNVTIGAQVLNSLTNDGAAGLVIEVMTKAVNQNAVKFSDIERKLSSIAN